MAALAAEETTTRERCMAALESGRRQSDLMFFVTRKSDEIRVAITVRIPASAVSLTQTGDKSQAFLTWWIIQRDESGKRFGELWKGEIHLNMLPESLEAFRRDGVRIDQTLIASDTANLQIVVCDGQSGKAGSQTIPAYEQRSQK